MIHSNIVYSLLRGALIVSMITGGIGVIHAESHQYTLRMTPQEFNKMSRREVSLELSAIESPSKRRNVWRATSRRYFKRSSSCQQSNSEPCPLPFVVCDSTPKLSSYERKQLLYRKLRSSTPKSKRSVVKLDETPFYTHSEKTCFTASIPPKVAQKLASESCDEDTKNCTIHPVLPMMKVSYGTVDIITRNTDNGDSVITIFAELSPYHKQKTAELSLDEMVQTTLERGEMNEGFRSHLKDTFPSTESSLGCETQTSLGLSQIEAKWIGKSTAAFYITPSASDSPKEVREKILRFIAGLAVRSEVSVIETMSYEDYYFY